MSEFPKELISGSETMEAYSVECRTVGTPFENNGEIITKEWRMVKFSPKKLVPETNCDHLLFQHGLLSKPWAEQVRWTFIAMLEHRCPISLLETRLIRHKITQEFKVQALGAERQEPSEVKND